MLDNGRSPKFQWDQGTSGGSRPSPIIDEVPFTADSEVLSICSDFPTLPLAMQRARRLAIVFLVTLLLIWSPCVALFAIEAYVLDAWNPRYGQHANVIFGAIVWLILAAISATSVTLVFAFDPRCRSFAGRTLVSSLLFAGLILCAMSFFFAGLLFQFGGSYSIAWGIFSALVGMAIIRRDLLGGKPLQKFWARLWGAHR